MVSAVMAVNSYQSRDNVIIDKNPLNSPLHFFREIPPHLLIYR